MSVFYGTHRLKLDEKNRMRLPARFKAILAGRPAVIMRGIQNCLFVLPEDELENLLKGLENAPLSDLDAQNALRALTESIMPIEEDNQGRSVLAPYLKEYAEIDKDVVFVGVRDRIEVWSEKSFDRREIQGRDSIDRALATVKDRYGV